MQDIAEEVEPIIQLMKNFLDTRRITLDLLKEIGVNYSEFKVLREEKEGEK